MLALALDMAMRGKMSLPTDFPGGQVYCRTVAFLRKYECKGSLSFLKMHAINQLLLHKTTPFCVFILAAAMDDVELSIQCFKKRRSDVYDESDVTRHKIPGVSSVPLLQDLLGLWPTSALEDGSLPHELWAEIPFDYMWAANKAWGRAHSVAWQEKIINFYEPSINKYYPPLASPPRLQKRDIAAEYEAAIKAVKTMT